MSVISHSFFFFLVFRWRACNWSTLWWPLRMIWTSGYIYAMSFYDVASRRSSLWVNKITHTHTHTVPVFTFTESLKNCFEGSTCSTCTLWLSVPHMGQRQKIQLIIQDLICSKWGEHVTEPVVNKSSQLLLLIITVITLIISNSAPWYERALVYSRLWMPRSPATTNYELCSGVRSCWQRKSELCWMRTDSFGLWVLGTCFWLPAFFVALWTSLWTMLLKTDGELEKKKQCGVIDTCGKWVTFGHVSICKLLMIHSGC